MDKLALKSLLENKLRKQYDSYKNRIASLSEWQINNLLPSDLLQATMSDKLNFLLDKYTKENPLYTIVSEDLNRLETGKDIHSSNQLKSTQLDPRFLESIGLNEIQIANYFKFIEEVKSKFI